MKSVVSASAYRRLVLLNILFLSEEPLAKRELAELAGCSLNTMKADIEVINSIFPEQIGHIYDKDKKYVLVTAPSVNFDYLTAYMIATSDLFTLSLSIFKDEKLTPAEWTARTYIGMTSFYNKLKEADTFLANSRLILDNSPLQILGNEMNIRFYFFHLFSKSYPHSGWVIEDFDYESMDRFIRKLEDHLDISFSLTARVDYAIAIGVSLTRIKQGYLADLTDERDYMEDLESYYDATHLDFGDLEKDLGQPLSKVERHLILLLCSLGSFSYTDHSRIDFRMAYHKKYRNERYQLGNELSDIIRSRVKDPDQVTVVTLDYLTHFTFVEKKHLIMDVDHFTQQKLPKTVDMDRILAVLAKYERHPGYTYIRNNKDVIASYIHDLYTFVLLNEEEGHRLHVRVVAKNGYFWEVFFEIPNS